MSAYDPKRTYALQQAAAYSITSLERTSMVAGIVRPSRFGSLEIDYQIEFGRVRGFAPFSIRSTFVEFVVWYDK